MRIAAPTAEPLATSNSTLPRLEQLLNDTETIKRRILELLATLHHERRDKYEL